MVHIWLPDQGCKEWVRITEPSAVDDVVVRDEAISPIQTNTVLPST